VCVVYAEGGSPSKRRRITEASGRWQSFVQSAAKCYRQWEQAEKAVDKPRVEEGEGHKNFFLAVSGNLFSNFHEGFLIWIRQCYKDLKEIMAKAKPGDRFTLLGTSGIGKSYFTIFGVCYRATLKEKVVWKVNDTFHLLDFSVSNEASSFENAKVAKAYGPFQRDDLELREVFDDPAAWLIIDGEQRGDFDCRCHILLACSSIKEESYHEFSKSQLVRTLYMPVWEEEEIIKFLNDFEVHRANYSHMEVPIKDEVMEYFERLGGVPRYVLCARKIATRLEELETAVTKLHQLTLQELEDLHDEGAKDANDWLFHITWDKEKDKLTYAVPFSDFASVYVKCEFIKRFFGLHYYGKSLEVKEVTELPSIHSFHNRKALGETSNCDTMYS
jgi:hypothetical protein